MPSRPTVSIWNKDNTAAGEHAMPNVFEAPIRDDIVQFCHSNMAKNRRQAHGVFWQQGHQHSAESWGTGRAVARIPRIGGSGTHRSGQAAFGNMCRKGRMFAPLRTWRKWHRKVNTNQKRHAVASALAAAACPPLVQARGHRCDNVPELPLVVSSSDLAAVEKTQSLISTLHSVGIADDLNRVRKSRTQRAGNGKMRHSRFVIRKGPLIIYGDETASVKRVARNLPGVDVCHVNRLNLLQLAPGGHLGRLVVFAEDAFKQLDAIFGSHRQASAVKSGYHLQREVMDCADLARIINSDTVQSVIRGVRITSDAKRSTKKNPLKNRAAMQRLNPAANALAKAKAAALAARQAARNARTFKKAERAAKTKRTERFHALAEGLEDSFKAAQKIIDDEIKAGLLNQDD